MNQGDIFKIWGFAGGLAIRNIIVFFLIVQMMAIVYLVGLNNSKDVIIREAATALVKSKDEMTVKVQELNDRHLRTVQEMQLFFQKQVEIERNVQRNAVKIERLTKR